MKSNQGLPVQKDETMNTTNPDSTSQVTEWLAEHRDLDDIKPTGLPFITISRQAGAGGHLLSYVLLTDFIHFKNEPLFNGWHVFDKELCELVARNQRLEKSMGELLSENYKSDFKDFMDTLFTGNSTKYQAIKQTFKVVRMLAMAGKTIIVGRAGCCTTQDLKGGIHIRLVASEEKRILWMMKRFKLSKQQARATIEKQDADRTKLLKNYFNREIDDPLTYDIVWNTGTVDLPEISHAIIDMIRNRAQITQSKS
jgi:cytidylate kinase